MTPAAGGLGLEACAADAEADGDAWLSLLNSRLRKRLRGAGARGTRKSTRTAIRRLQRFAAGPARGRTLFVAPRWRGDLQASAHNEWSLLLWAEEMACLPSRKTRRPLRAGTIATYVSLVKTELATEYGFELTSDARRLRRVLKDMRSVEPEATRRRARSAATPSWPAAFSATPRAARAGSGAG